MASLSIISYFKVLYGSEEFIELTIEKSGNPTLDKIWTDVEVIINMYNISLIFSRRFCYEN